MIVNGLMRYHIRCATQPPIDGQSLAGGSSAAEGAASTPRPVAGNGKAKPHQPPATPTLMLTPTATGMAANRTVGLKNPSACRPS